METQNTLQWKGFAISIPGFGHIRRDIPCQDASLAVTACRPALIVCDGRGSAAHSHFGSQAAVKMFRSQLAILEPHGVRKSRWTPIFVWHWQIR